MWAGVETEWILQLNNFSVADGQRRIGRMVFDKKEWYLVKNRGKVVVIVKSGIFFP